MRSAPSGRGSRSGARPEGRKPGGTEAEKGEIYLEFIPAGAYIKVVAIDPVTGTEVSIVGDGKADQAALERTVVAKLRYVLEKQKR